MLFGKGRIGNMVLKNRVFMAPMSARGEADGRYQLSDIDYFEERASGGAGLVITGMNIVLSKFEDRPCTEISSFNHVERLAMLVERCHIHGAKVCVEISPGLGRVTFIDDKTAPHAASACSSFWFPDMTCIPFTVDEIHELEAAMGRAAYLCKAAGADGVELHAYGGYLMDQFQTSLWNKRTDEYGGSLGNRMRFTTECIREIRRQAGDDFAVITKFAPYHGVEGGTELPEGIQMAKILEDAGSDALHVDVGCYEVWHKSVPTPYSEPGAQLDIDAAVREAVSIPVLGTGGLEDPELAEDALRSGKLDFVGLAHGLLADAAWPNKVKAGHTYDIRPCIGCNACLAQGLVGKRNTCAVNPRALQEGVYDLPKPIPGESRKVLVIGGGPGGMAAAVAAARRGFKVSLWEREYRLGGRLEEASFPEFKHGMAEYLGYLRTQVHRLGIDARLGREVTGEEREIQSYDKVVVATGARYRMPEFAGSDQAISFSDAIRRGKWGGGRRVAVLGGGLVGSELAVHLSRQGAKVFLLTRREDPIAGLGLVWNNELALRELLANDGVEIVGNVQDVSYEGEDVAVNFQGGNCKEKVLPVDDVVVARGLTSDTSLAEKIEGIARDVSVIGDAVSPRNVLSAVHEAYHAIRLM